MQENGSKDRRRPREWKSAPGGKTACVEYAADGEEDGSQRRTGVRWLLGKVPEGADGGWRLGSHLQGAKEGHLQRRGCCAVGLGTRAHHYTPTYQASPLRPSKGR